MAYEACRLAVKYMTPVILLSDGYLANGSEPWLIPDPDALESFKVDFAKKTNGSQNGEDAFLPYKRDDDTLARPWAKPGTKGLEHRIGGLSKEHETGNVSYDPHNNELMVKMRADKVQGVQADIPATEIYGKTSGDLLVVGWGSTRGTIEAAVERAVGMGYSVGSAHIRHINPLPPDLAEIFSRFDKILVPEINAGQLIRVLRDEFLLPFEGLNKVQGQPFKASEIVTRIEEALS
jgi:2-oxoglutarate ferredoxin oxidoreductase subunit alpha